MFGAINKSLTAEVDYGPGQTAKTIGYTLFNGDGTTFQARATTGVTEIQAGTGIYRVRLASSVFTAAFDGYVLWDVAGGAPYAREDIYISDRLDVAVSTRSTYAGADTPGTTSLLSRIASALTITAGKVDVNDKTGFALTSAYDAAKTAAQAGDAMALTAGERTTLAASLWGALTSGLSTVGSIGKLVKDNLDAAISSRNSVAPDNATIASTKTELDTVKAKTDNLPADPASQASVLAAIPSAATIATTVWAAGARTLTAVSDSAGVTTLVGRLTSVRAAFLDYLDAPMSTRATPADVTTNVNADLAGLEATAAAIQEKTDLIGTGNATVASPITGTGQINLKAGDDYLAADGRAITFTPADNWPDLTGATVRLKIGPSLTVTGTIGSTLSFELTSTQTAALKKDRDYAVVATLADGHIATLAAGRCTTT